MLVKIYKAEVVLEYSKFILFILGPHKRKKTSLSQKGTGKLKFV